MKSLLNAMAVAWSLAISAQAADHYTETFSAAGAAPSSSLSLGAGSWTFTGGVAQAKFANSLPISIPDIATLRPSNAAFTGNYVAAGIGVIGFKFRSAVELPSSVYVELKGGTSVFQRVIPVKSVGAWESFMISLSSLDAGNWTVLDGRADDFPEALRDVRSVEIKVQRSGATAREYAIDDFYVDGLPGASGGLASPGALNVSWGSLRAGEAYMVQKSEHLEGPWSDTASAVVTGSVYDFSLPQDGGADQLFYRLRGP